MPAVNVQREQVQELERKVLECIECLRQFGFTESEQRFFARQGFPPPKRCQECRHRLRGVREGR